MALGSRIGSLYVRVGADTRDFHRQMDRANKPLERFRVTANAAIKSFALIGGAAAAASAGVYALARSEMNLIDEQAKLARSIGGTVTGLRTLKLAAEDNGIDGLEGSLNRLNRRLGAVEMGGGPAAETVKRLGLNIKELSEMDVDVRLASIADTIHDSGMSAQEAARHLQQLGFQQQEATTFFMQGGDAIRSARTEITAYGMAVDMLSAARIEEANTQLSRMSLVASGLKTQLAVGLAPTMLQTTQTLANVAREMMKVTFATDDTNDAIDELGQSSFVTDFVHPATVGLARMLDVMLLLGRAAKAVGMSFKAVAADVEAFDKSFMDQDAGWITDELAKKHPDWAAQQLKDENKSAEQALKEREQIVADANKAWTDLWNVPANQYEQAALQGIATELPEVSVPGRGRGSGGTGGGKDDGKAKKELEENQRRLEALQQFLADRDEIEMLASAKRLSDLDTVRAAGLISEEVHLQMLAGISAKHFETMAELQDDDNREKLEKLAELRELELLGLQEYTAQQLEQLLAHEEAQTELAVDAYEARKEILDELREISELEDEEYRERLLEAEQQLQDDLTLIAARGAHERNAVSAQEASARSRVMSGMMGNLVQLMNSGNKEMFRIGKIAAISQATIKGYQAVVDAYQAGMSVGGPAAPAIAAAYAATAAVATAAQISSIASTSFGGGGSVSSRGGGGGGYSRPTDQIADDPQPTGKSVENSTVTINLTGEIFNRQQVRELIEQINDATADGATLRLN